MSFLKERDYKLFWQDKAPKIGHMQVASADAVRNTLLTETETKSTHANAKQR
jgi:hypothetical protein